MLRNNMKKSSSLTIRRGLDQGEEEIAESPRAFPSRSSTSSLLGGANQIISRLSVSRFEGDPNFHRRMETSVSSPRPTASSVSKSFPSHHSNSSFSTFSILVFIFFSLSFVLFILVYSMIPHHPSSTDHLLRGSAVSNGRHKHHNQIKNPQILLFGDSLLNIPYSRYDLEGKIKSHLPQCLQGITVINKGRNGHKVQDLKSRLTNDVLLLKPDVVFIHFDSDVSDQLVDFLNLKSTQEKYQEDLDYIVSMMINYKIPHIAVAGPGVLREGSLFTKSRFYGKETLLDRFKEFNKKIASRYDLPYIDIREAFQKSSSLWPISLGWVTYDGEHPNDRGSAIIAQLFAAQLQEWYHCE